MLRGLEPLTQKAPSIAIVGEAQHDMRLKVEFAKVAYRQSTDIETADVLETFRRRRTLSQLQCQSILPWINVREHAAVMNQRKKLTAAPGAQSRHHKIKA
jgi:hypothetical protein